MLLDPRNMLFPILWFIEYLPGGFRFFVALVIFAKMMKDVHNYNWKYQNQKPVGVLKKQSNNGDKITWENAYQNDSLCNKLDNAMPSAYNSLHQRSIASNFFS